MKKLIPTALILVLAGFQLVTVAQPAHVHEHENSAAQSSNSGDMKAMQDEMQKKMASAKTDAERQKIMAEQHKGMPSMHGQMNGQMHAQMGGHDHGAMKGMPSGDPEMQKRMQSMREQMGK